MTGRTTCATKETSVTLSWNHGAATQTMPLQAPSYIALICSVPSFGCYDAFMSMLLHCDDNQLMCMPAHLIPMDDDDPRPAPLDSDLKASNSDSNNKEPSLPLAVCFQLKNEREGSNQMNQETS